MEINAKIVERSSTSLIDAVVRNAVPADKPRWNEWFFGMSSQWEDHGWDWDKLIDLSLALPSRFEVYVVEAAGQLQGLRMLEIEGDDVEQFDSIHAMRLATAPWNRPPDRVYYGVGSVLVGVAIKRSIELGWDGRCYCESLPAAIPFHERNGMERFDGVSDEGLPRYQFTSESAESFLTRLESDGLL